MLLISVKAHNFSNISAEWRKRHLFLSVDWGFFLYQQPQGLNTVWWELLLYFEFGSKQLINCILSLMCCRTFGEGYHCVLSFFTVNHENSSGQGIPYLVSIMREMWQESWDLHVLSLLGSRSKQSHSRHESNVRQAIQPRGQQPGPAVLGGGARKAQKGPCGDTHRPAGWFPAVSRAVPASSSIIPGSN